MFSTGPRAVRLTLVTLAVFALGATFVGGIAPDAGAATSNTLTVAAGEYTYKFSGKAKPGWVEIRFDNGGVEAHMMAIVALKSGVTAKQLEKAAISEGGKAFEKVIVNADVTGTPDLLSQNESTATISQLKAGHYGVLCFVPAPDGSPHIAHGMVDVFDIKGSKSSFKPPRDGVQDVTITDTAITLPAAGLTKTANVKVTNEGSEPHSFTLIRLSPGRTIDEAFKYFDAFFETGSASGTAPGAVVGGISSVRPGGIAYVELDLEPGRYGYVSTSGDAPDDDYTKGLKGEFEVK